MSFHSIGKEAFGGTVKRVPVAVSPIVKNGCELRESLGGGWRFRLDPEDAGLNEKWYEKPSVISGEIDVPGSWQGQGHGSDGLDTLWDFNLSTRVFRSTYKGTGWYRKDFALPAGWGGKRVWLNFGGAFPTAEVWLNGIKLGEHHMPFVPFAFEITDCVRHGAENCAVVRISEDDRLFGLSYSWMGCWSGLYRDVELTATGRRYIDSFLIYAMRAHGSPSRACRRLQAGLRVMQAMRTV